jgi:hypothetical protein
MFNYHDADGEKYSFQSRYLVKIIDYGRCFYNDKINRCSSLAFYQTIIVVDKSFKTHGYSALSQNGSEKHYFIDIKKRNKSHDLRLLDNFHFYYFTEHYSTMNKKIEKPFFSTGLINYIKQYGNYWFPIISNDLKYHHKYGTPEAENSSKNEICNVTDVKNRICWNIRKYKERDNYFSNSKPIAELNIYTDKKMGFKVYKK